MGRLKTGNLATRILASAAMVAAFTVASAQPAQAASENECAIWLCLPMGFAHSACKKPRKAFFKRLRKGKSPLPGFAGCTNGGSQGSYNMGYEPFEDCPAGWLPRHSYDDERRSFYRRAKYGHRDVTGGAISRMCVDPKSCRRSYGFGRDGEDSMFCSRQAPAPRNKDPYFIDMTIDGEAQPRYYYNLNGG